MNQRQIELAETLLSYLSDQGGQANKDFYPEYLVEKGFSKPEYSQVVPMLIEKKLVAFVDDNEYTLRISEEGYKALKLGLKRYLNKDDRRNKIMIILTIITALMALLAAMFF